MDWSPFQNSDSQDRVGCFQLIVKSFLKANDGWMEISGSSLNVFGRDMGIGS